MFEDGTFEIDAGGPVAISDDLERPLLGRKKALAFQLSAMGSPTTNFYNDAYSRIGYAEPAARACAVPRRQARRGDRGGARRDGAAHLVHRHRGDGPRPIRVYRDAGVTALRLQPMGRTAGERLDTLAHMLDLVRDVDAATRRLAGLWTLVALTSDLKT